jgi:hypothetical protein
LLVLSRTSPVAVTRPESFIRLLSSKTVQFCSELLKITAEFHPSRFGNAGEDCQLNADPHTTRHPRRVAALTSLLQTQGMA